MAEARRDGFGPDSLGWVAFKQARAAREAASSLLHANPPLRHSDGTAAALVLLAQACQRAIVAHLERLDMPTSPATDSDALWASFLKTGAAEALSGVDDETLAEARMRMGIRALDEAAALEDATRRAAIRALQLVCARLLGALHHQYRRPTRLWLLRAVKIGVVLTVPLVLMISSISLWRAHRRGPNIALGRPTQTSSTFAQYNSSAGAVDGRVETFGFHTQEEDNPWIQIDLGEDKRIREIMVHNRPDCCQERAVPLVMEVSGDGTTYREVSRRKSEFQEWRAHVETEGRYVRLRVPRKTSLHLAEVAVFSE